MGLFDVVGKNGINAEYIKDKNLLNIDYSKQNYSAVEKFTLNTLPNNKNLVSIGDSNKLVMLGTNGMILDSKITIILDDSTPWKTGQSVEIFGISSLVGQSEFEIYTGAVSKYELLIYSGELIKNKTIKLTCIDAKNFEFLIR